ncbi:MAG: hypothetical protein JXA21_10435 [Anaerolineae bacterium]|nr:hypothetical protein [Anaerolineae bacterium]
MELMLDEDQLSIVEYGLRLVIGQYHHNACTARREKRQRVEIDRLNALYLDAIETYRHIFRRDLVAHSVGDELDERGFVILPR